MLANSTLLRDAIPTEISHGVAPVGEMHQQGNFIHNQKFHNENTENIEITEFLRDLLRTENFSGATMTDPTREEIKAEISASEARGETKITLFAGKLDLVLSKLDDVRQDNRTSRANQWVIGFGLAVLIVAVAALFPVFFSMGSQIRDLVHMEVHDQLPKPK